MLRLSRRAEGLVVYQETYNRETYAEMHTSGPKRDFNWRLISATRLRCGISAHRNRRCLVWLPGSKKRSGLPPMWNTC